MEREEGTARVEVPRRMTRGKEGDVAIKIFSMNQQGSGDERAQRANTLTGGKGTRERQIFQGR